MKKFLVLALALLMLLSLAACGNKEETPAGNESQTENTQNKTDNTAEPEQTGDPAEYSMDYWAENIPVKMSARSILKSAAWNTAITVSQDLTRAPCRHGSILRLTGMAGILWEMTSLTATKLIR